MAGMLRSNTSSHEEDVEEAHQLRQEFFYLYGVNNVKRCPETTKGFQPTKWNDPECSVSFD